MHPTAWNLIDRTRKVLKNTIMSTTNVARYNGAPEIVKSTEEELVKSTMTLNLNEQISTASNDNDDCVVDREVKANPLEPKLDLEECRHEKAVNRFLRQLVQEQAGFIEPHEREAFRRRNAKRVLLRRKLEQRRKQEAREYPDHQYAIGGEPNMGLFGEAKKTQEEIGAAAANVNRILEDPRLESILSNTELLANVLRSTAVSAEGAVNSVHDFFQVPDMARFMVVAGTTLAQIMLVKTHSLIFLFLEIVKICAYLIPNNLTHKLTSLKDFVTSDLVSLFTKTSSQTPPPPVGATYQPNEARKVDIGTPNAGTSVNVEGFAKKFVHKTVALITGSDEAQVKKVGTIKSFGDLGRSVQGVDMGVNTLMKWAVAIFEAIQKVTARLIGGAILPVGEIQNFNTGVCELLDVDPTEFGKRQYAERLQALHRQALGIKRKLENKSLSLDRVSTIIVNNNIKQVLEHYKDNRMNILSIIHSKKSRRTPFFTQFVGNSGSGKSTVMKAYARTLTAFKNCGVEFDQEDLFYHMSRTNFMDGFRMQDCILDDDMWQLDDGETNGKNEYMDCITRMSNVNFQVDMANIENKGMPFTCQLYIGSTNNPYPKPKNIVHKEALWRRRSSLLLTASRNWHTQNRLFNYDLGEEWDSLNWMCFKRMDPVGEDTWSNSLKELETFLESNTQSCPNLPDGWVSFYTICRADAEKFRRHLKQADPKWIDGLGLPTCFEDLDQMPTQRKAQKPAPLSGTFAEAAASSSTVNVETLSATFASAPPAGENGRPNFIFGPSEPISDDESSEESDDEEYADGNVYEYDEGELEVLSDYPAFTEERGLHELAMVICNHGCEIHPRVCCCDTITCNGTGYLRHYCGSYGFYADEDECGFFGQGPEDRTTPDDVGWNAILEAWDINVPMDYVYRPLNELDAQQGEANMALEDGNMPRDYPLPPLIDDSAHHCFENEFLVALGEVKAKFPKRAMVAASILTVFAAIGAVTWMFKLQANKSPRDKTPVERIGEKLTEVLDSLETVPEMPEATKQKITRALVEAQGAVANGSFYESGVPRKGPTGRMIKAKVAQATKNSGSAGTLSERVRRMDDNLIRLRSKKGESDELYHSLSALGLYNRYVVVNKHFIEACEWDEEHRETVMDIMRYGTWTNIRIPWTDMMEFEDDLVVFKLPKGHMLFRDIRKYFADDANLKYGGEMLLTGRQNDGKLLQHSTTYAMRGKLEYAGYTLVHTWLYKIHANLQGMCCSVVWDAQTCAIIGLHVASGVNDVDNKFAMPMTKSGMESIVDAIERQWETKMTDETDGSPFVAEINSGTIRVSGTVQKLGSATERAAQHTVAKTKLRQSPIFGVFENAHWPSVLTMKDKRISEEAKQGETIHEKGINKYGSPIVPWKGKHRRYAQEAINHVITNQKVTMPRRLLTDHEMLNGTEDGALKALDMDSSAGWPWCKDKPSSVRGKLNIFENTSPEGEKKNWVWKDSEQAREVQESMAKLEEAYRKGDNIDWLSYSNIKDELRSEAKILEANSRSFDCVPIEVTLLFRKYFGMFVAQQHQNCASSPISVGIDAHSQWTALAHRMLKRGDALIAGDYKNWDGSVSAEEMLDGVDMINRWYEVGDIGHPEHIAQDTVRQMLVYAATHAYVAVGDSIVRKHQGLPSGIPLTAVLNSLINWQRLLCCVQEIYDDSACFPDRLSPQDLAENIDLLLYGDDHVVSLAPELRERINFIAVQNKFAEHGIKYTDSRKLGAVFDFETLAEITYLKRTFVPYGSHHYIGPLDITSVQRMANWLHENKRIGALDMLACVKNSLKDELALHGRAVYTTCRLKFNNAIDEVRALYPLAESDPKIVESFETADEQIRQRLGLFNVAHGMRTSKIDPFGNKSVRYINGAKITTQKWQE
jgi:ABC-type oligopeptide transport system ATPase subunit